MVLCRNHANFLFIIISGTELKGDGLKLILGLEKNFIFNNLNLSHEFDLDIEGTIEFDG